MIKVNDYIYTFPFEERRDRPNISVILGKNFNVLVDFGISEKHLDEVIDSFTKAGIEYPRVGVLTHYHYDHSFAIPFFKGISIGCKRSNDYLKVLSSVPMNEAFVSSYLSGPALKFCLDAMHEEYSDFKDIKVKTTDVSFNNYLKLDLGDKIVELFHLPAPHSDDSVYVKANDVLFIGDAFFYDIFNGETSFDKEKLKALYALIEGFDVTTIVEGHSNIKTKNELLDEIQKEIEE